MLDCYNLLLATDHKPLVGVFAKNLEDIEKPRLLSIAEKTMWFKFTTIHVPGKLNNGPDFMSRHSGSTVPPARRMCRLQASVLRWVGSPPMACKLMARMSM